MFILAGAFIANEAVKNKMEGVEIGEFRESKEKYSELLDGYAESMHQEIRTLYKKYPKLYGKIKQDLEVFVKNWIDGAKAKWATDKQRNFADTLVLQEKQKKDLLGFDAGRYYVVSGLNARFVSEFNGKLTDIIQNADEVIKKQSSEKESQRKAFLDGIDQKITDINTQIVKEKSKISTEIEEKESFLTSDKNTLIMALGALFVLIAVLFIFKK